MLATRREALAVLCDVATARTSSPGRDVVAQAESTALDAVRTVPELRWAAVDLVLPEPPADPAPVVERITTDPVVTADDRLVAGGMEDFFRSILPPGLGYRSASESKPWRPWKRRQ